MIIRNDDYISNEMKSVLKYNSIQERILNILTKADPLRNNINELIVMMLNNKYIKSKIGNGFSLKLNTSKFPSVLAWKI